MHKNLKKMSDGEIVDTFNKLGLLTEADRERFNFAQVDISFINIDDKKKIIFFLAGPALLEEKETVNA